MNIYLAQQNGTDFYKIGITKKKPELRIKELQIGSPTPINLIQSYRTKYNFLLESALHSHFKLKQINSEWFKLEPEDVQDFISTCQKLEQTFVILKDNFFFKNKY